MSSYGRAGITNGEANKLLEEANLLPLWNGSSRAGDFSGHSTIAFNNGYGEVSESHTLRFETQAGYMAFMRTLEVAVKIGYSEATKRMNKAL